MSEDLAALQNNEEPVNGLINLLSGNDRYYCVSSRKIYFSLITKPLIFPNTCLETRFAGIFAREHSLKKTIFLVFQLLVADCGFSYFPGNVSMEHITALKDYMKEIGKLFLPKV